MSKGKDWQCDNPHCHALNKPQWDQCIACGKPRPVTVVIDGQQVDSLGEFIEGIRKGKRNGA